ncbi:MAG: nitrilase-related carbon-nitrogen hydrolase [Thermotogota bacterium]
MIVCLLTQNIIQNEEKENSKMIINYAGKVARENQSALLLTPELSLQGFPDKLEQPVKPINVKSIEEIRKAASHYGLSIGFGYFEQLDEDTYNTYTIINSKGKRIVMQRKRKTFKFAKEDRFIKMGTVTNDFIFADMYTRIVICYGLRFPQLFSAESKHPHLYIVPANWPKARILHWEVLLKARAIENQAWVIGVNRTGGIYNGHSMVITPNGDVTAKSNEGLLSFPIERETVLTIRKEFPFNEVIG